MLWFGWYSLNGNTRQGSSVGATSNFNWGEKLGNLPAIKPPATAYGVLPGKPVPILIEVIVATNGTGTEVHGTGGNDKAGVNNGRVDLALQLEEPDH